MKNVLVTVLLFWLTLSNHRRAGVIKRTWIMLTIFNNYMKWPPYNQNCLRTRILAGLRGGLGDSQGGGVAGEKVL